ncbi:hypothetical protein [Pseudomonas sp.]|uniref:hypothetical protein n=1 Tax=Pseudomonas sp. TaxID=306 RepID=UPI003F3D6CE0
MTEDQLNAALQAEYLHIQKTIEDFDARALTIKAWSVTFGLAAITGAFISNSCIALLLAALSAAIFWVLETQWKLFQLCYYERSGLIEAHFAGEKVVEHPFQISIAWLRTWREIRYADISAVAQMPHVALPHVIVMGMGVLLFILAILQIIEL